MWHERVRTDFGAAYSQIQHVAVAVVRRAVGKPRPKPVHVRQKMRHHMQKALVGRILLLDHMS